MRLRLVVTALVLCLAAAGCSDDDEGDGAATSTTGTPGITTGAPTDVDPQEAADALKAGEIVLKQSDFPAGFTALPQSAEEDEAEDRAGEEFEACLGVSVDDDERPRAESPDFQSSQFTRVSSSAAFAPTVEDSSNEFAAMQGPKLPDCVRSQFDKELKTEAADVEFAPIEVAPVEFPTLGDGTRAVRLSTAVAAADGAPVAIHADFVFIRKGRAQLTLSFVNAGEPFPADVAADLAGKMAARA